jgi:hypothetical protein
MIPTTTTSVCKYCSSPDVGAANSYHFRKCNACERHFEDLNPLPSNLLVLPTTRTGGSKYAKCPKCEIETFCNTLELVAGSVWCARCKIHFTVPKESPTPPQARSFGGEHHVLLRIRGHEGSIALFHRMVKLCDGDWPFVGRPTVRVCRTCAGVVWNSPRIGPEDLKAAARQVGGMKVKIRHFAPTKGCYTAGSFNYTRDVVNIPLSEAQDLFRSGGPDRFREKHTPTPPKVGGASEEGLITEVLGVGTPAVEGSVCQTPGVSRFDQHIDFSDSGEPWGGLVN